MSLSLPNPFGGIICAPYYHILIAILITWIVLLLQVFYLSFLSRKRDLLTRTIADTSLITNGAKRRLNKRVYTEMQEELTSTRIEISDTESLFIPPEIINLILSMLPNSADLRQVNYWMRYAELEIPRIYRQITIVDALQTIYPLIRFIANFICFIIILIRYAKWVTDHTLINGWNKYLGFVIALLYMPLFKLTGTSHLLICECISQAEVVDFRIYNIYKSWYLKYIYMDIAYIVFFVLVSIPVFIPGIFVYIPNLIGLILITLILSIIWKCITRHEYQPIMYRYPHPIYDICDKINYKIIDPLKAFAGESVFWFFGFYFVFILMWWIMISVTSMIALYQGESYGDSYRFGFFGEYCHATEYVSFAKSYQCDIIFLIASWIVF